MSSKYLSNFRFSPSLYKNTPCTHILISLRHLKGFSNSVNILAGKDEVTSVLDLVCKERPLAVIVEPLRKTPFWSHGEPFIHSGLWLHTEVFSGHAGGGLSLGSTRHCFVGNCLLKGTGMNELCHGTDYDHAWGGQWIQDGLKEYFHSSIFGGLLPEGVVDVFYLSLPHDHNSKPIEVDGCMIVQSWRELETPRLAQVDHDFLFDDEIEATKELLHSRFGSFETAVYKLTLQYASAEIFNLRQRSAIKENFALGGEFLDLNSVDYIDSESICSVMTLQVPAVPGEDPLTTAERALSERGSDLQVINTDLSCNLLIGLLGQVRALARFYGKPYLEDAVKKIFRETLLKLAGEMGADVGTLENYFQDLLSLAEKSLHGGGKQKDYSFSFLKNMVENSYPLLKDCASEKLIKELTFYKILKVFSYQGKVFFVIHRPLVSFGTPHDPLIALTVAYNRRENRKDYQELMADLLLWMEYNSSDDIWTNSEAINRTLNLNTKLNPFQILDGKLSVKSVNLKETIESFHDQLNLEILETLVTGWSYEGSFTYPFEEINSSHLPFILKNIEFKTKDSIFVPVVCPSIVTS